MNLKKTVVSLFAATAIVGSMLMPAYAEKAPSNAATTEGGVLLPAVVSDNETGKIDFDTASVTATDGAILTSTERINVNDGQADSPGWTVQVSATIMTGVGDSAHFIQPKQLTVSKSTDNFINFCKNKNLPNNPSNPWQGRKNHLWTSSSAAHPLDTPVTILSSDGGRGCNGIKAEYVFTLNVLPGQNVDVYTGDIIIDTVSPEPTTPGAQ